MYQFLLIFDVIQQQQILYINFMFSSLQNYKPIISTNSKTMESYNRQSQSCPLDLQYQICSRYIKMTSEQFYQKELELILNTEKFIDKINQNLALKDISTTQESLTMENFLDQEDPFSCDTKSKILLRKSQSNSSIRRTESGITEALRQVKKKCSQKTSVFFSNMTGEFRRLKQKQLSFSKHQKDLKKLQQKYNIKQQELFLLRKRISDLQNQNISINKECETLKAKIKDLNQESNKNLLNRSKYNDNLLSIHHSMTFQKLKKYLQEKEFIIFKRQKQIKLIDERITLSVQNIVNEGSCTKCCELIRRVKDSIMKYRTYLQEESNLAEDLYNKYKASFL